MRVVLGIVLLCVTYVRWWCNVQRDGIGKELHSCVFAGSLPIRSIKATLFITLIMTFLVIIFDERHMSTADKGSCTFGRLFSDSFASGLYYI